MLGLILRGIIGVKMGADNNDRHLLTALIHNPLSAYADADADADEDNKN
jgi:hypothetical protein